MFGKDRAATAFAARCLLRGARVATLATLADGQPFASLVTPAVTGSGAVLMLLSSLAAHTRHLAHEPRCALMVAGQAENLNPQTTPRLTLTGVATRQNDPTLRQRWLDHHPYATLYAGFTDFALWHIVPEAGLFVAGFARAAQLDAADLSTPPDIADKLAAASPSIAAACNADHAQALDRIAQAHGGPGHWRLLSLDADGFDLVQDDAVRRIAFPAPVRDAPGMSMALASMLAATQPHW